MQVGLNDCRMAEKGCVSTGGERLKEKRLTSSSNRSDDRTTDTGQDNKVDGVLLLIRLPHVGDHAERDRSSGTGETTEEPSDDDGSKILREGGGKLPDCGTRKRGRQSLLCARARHGNVWTNC